MCDSGNTNRVLFFFFLTTTKHVRKTIKYCEKKIISDQSPVKITRILQMQIVFV